MDQELTQVRNNIASFSRHETVIITETLCRNIRLVVAVPTLRRRGEVGALVWEATEKVP